MSGRARRRHDNAQIYRRADGGTVDMEQRQRSAADADWRHEGRLVGRACLRPECHRGGVAHGRQRALGFRTPDPDGSSTWSSRTGSTGRSSTPPCTSRSTTSCRACRSRSSANTSIATKLGPRWPSRGSITSPQRDDASAGRNVADVAYFYGEEAPLTAFSHRGRPPTSRAIRLRFRQPDALLNQLTVEMANSSRAGRDIMCSISAARADA